MNQWVQRIEGHALFKDVESLKSAIAAATPTADAADTTAIENLDRLSRIADHLDAALGQIDPLLTLPSWLETVRTHVSQSAACVINYSNDKNVAHLTTANTHADNILANAATFLMAASPRSDGNIRKAISDFSTHCGELTRSLEQEVAQTKTSATNLGTRLDELTTEITNLKQRLEAAITGFTQTFNESQTW